MSYLNIIRRFAADKSGAVTVDWVALTAAVVIIGIGIVYAVFGTDDTGIGAVSAALENQLGVAATNVADGVSKLGGLPTAAGGGGS